MSAPVGVGPATPGVTEDPAAPSNRGRLRRVFLYGLSRGVTEGLMGVRSLVLAPLLGPGGMGLWALFRLGLKYAPFAALGVNRGLEREAVRDGVRDAETPAAEEAGRAALGFNLVVFVPLALVLLAASFWVSDGPTRLVLRGVSAAALTDQLIAYALVHLRARGRLKAYAKLEVALAALNLVLSGLLAWRWGLAGAIAGFVFAQMVIVLLVLPQLARRPTLSRTAIRKMLGVGLPVMLASATSTALNTADRLMVGALAGTVVLGYYAFAASIAGLAASAAWAIRIVILPDVYAHAAKAGAVHAVRHHFEEAVLPFALLFSPLLGLAALGIGPSVMLVIPQFAPAVEPARVFIFTGVTFGLTSLGSIAVVAANHQRKLPLFAAAALAVNLSVSWVVLRAGGGLQAVAAGAVLSQGLYAAAVLDVGASVAGLSRARFLFGCLAPLAWCAAAVSLVGLLVPEQGFRSLLASVPLYALLLGPLYPPLLKAWVRLRHTSA